MPMSSPQMTRMFGLSPSLTARTSARTRTRRPSAAGKYSDPHGGPASPRPGDLAGDRRPLPAGVQLLGRGGAQGEAPNPPTTRNRPTAVRRRWRSHATGGAPHSPLSVERDDDLAVGAALLDVGQRLEGLVKWERFVDDRAEVAGVVERGQFAQLGAVGLHEQERVAHTELPGLLVDLAAQQPHRHTHELRRPELLGEPAVRRASHADRLSTRLEDCKGLLEVFAAE